MPRRVPRDPARRRRAGCAPGADDCGAVTVEAAIALGSLALVTVAAVGAVATVAASVRCIDAARELARLSARGEPERGRLIAERLAPGDAAVVLTVHGDEAVAEVSVTPMALLPVRVGGRAVAALEPGAVAGTSAATAGDGTSAATPGDDPPAEAALSGGPP